MGNLRGLLYARHAIYIKLGAFVFCLEHDPEKSRKPASYFCCKHFSESQPKSAQNGKYFGIPVHAQLLSMAYVAAYKACVQMFLYRYGSESCTAKH
jgi:hypothetical protein